MGLIHRDLKPANIMVLNQEDDHDVVKVLDFGLVKSFLPDRGLPNETEITQAGVILGSPQYMAPEQARNVSDPRSDVYSLGVVMFQMLMGRPPFQAAQSIDVIFKHLNEAPPVFAAVWPAHAVPQEVEALVMRCLYKRPEERFQSMDEVLEAIRRAAASAGFSGAFSSPRNSVTAGLPALPAAGSGPMSGTRPARCPRPAPPARAPWRWTSPWRRRPRSRPPGARCPWPSSPARCCSASAWPRWWPCAPPRPRPLPAPEPPGGGPGGEDAPPPGSPPPRSPLPSRPPWRRPRPPSRRRGPPPSPRWRPPRPPRQPVAIAS